MDLPQWRCETHVHLYIQPPTSQVNAATRATMVQVRCMLGPVMTSLAIT